MMIYVPKAKELLITRGTGRNKRHAVVTKEQT